MLKREPFAFGSWCQPQRKPSTCFSPFPKPFCPGAFRREKLKAMEAMQRSGSLSWRDHPEAPKDEFLAGRVLFTKSPSFSKKAKHTWHVVFFYITTLKQTKPNKTRKVGVFPHQKTKQNKDRSLVGVIDHPLQARKRPVFRQKQQATYEEQKWGGRCVRGWRGVWNVFFFFFGACFFWGGFQKAFFFLSLFFLASFFLLAGWAFSMVNSKGL